jgi:hypothetical protein
MTVTTSPSSFALALARAARVTVFARGDLPPALTLARAIAEVAFACTVTRRPFVVAFVVVTVVVTAVVVMSPRARPSFARSPVRARPNEEMNE